MLDNKKILLIDDSKFDNLINAKLIQTEFKNTQVQAFFSANEALQFLKDNQFNEEELPDILFVDIRMPEMDGFEFMDSFGQLSPTLKEKCKVFILTSSIDPGDKTRAEQNPNVLKFLNKPLSCKDLV